MSNDSSRPWRRDDDGAAAARAAARSFGVDDPVLVALHGAALWRSGDVALRVERPATDARRLLDVVGLAISVGVPVVAALRDEPFEHPGGQVTAWQWVDAVTDRAPDMACLGRALRILHEEVRPSDWRAVGAPPLLEQVERRLARNLHLLRGTAFDPEVTRLLDEQWTVWMARAAETLPTVTGPVALHGDAHTGNVITTADGCRLVHWELASVGPAAWDHGHVLMHVRRGFAPPRLYDDLAAGYGRDLRAGGEAEPWVRLHELLATARTASRSLRDPRLRDDARARVGWWR